MVTEIILGGGCFWCLEAVYQRIEGVISVTSGYSGGEVTNPTYEQVCNGKTGHAEVVKIQFDPKIISLEDILRIFWKIHDPTSLNRQGADVGSQYRSAIYYTNQNQVDVIHSSILNEQKNYSNNIVTEVKPLDAFYQAEDYHQNYFNNHPYQGYCQAVIHPKLAKAGLS